MHGVLYASIIKDMESDIVSTALDGMGGGRTDAERV